MSDTREYLRDKQQLVTWSLNLAALVAIGVGGWFFSGLRTDMGALTSAVVDLRTQVAVLATENKRLVDLAGDLRAHENSAGHPVMVDRIAALRARVESAAADRWTRRDHEAYAREVEARFKRLETQ